MLQLVLVIDLNGVVYMCLLGFGGGGCIVDNDSKYYGFSLNYMLVDGYEIGFDFDDFYQQYDNMFEFNLDIGEIFYLLGICDSIESLW